MDKNQGTVARNWVTSLAILDSRLGGLPQRSPGGVIVVGQRADGQVPVRAIVDVCCRAYAWTRYRRALSGLSNVRCEKCALAATKGKRGGVSYLQ